MATDEEKSSALDAARRESSSVNTRPVESPKNSGRISGAINTAKNMGKMATPIGVFSLLKQANLLKDFPFVFAYAAAIIKDFSDLVFGPTVILPMLLSILCSIFIFMMMIWAGFSGKGKKASSFLKGFFLVGGGMIDAVPGLAFFPIETATVTIIYMLTLSERTNTKE